MCVLTRYCIFSLQTLGQSEESPNRIAIVTLSCLKICSSVTWGKPEYSWQCVTRPQNYERKHHWVQKKGCASLEVSKLKQYEMPCLKMCSIFTFGKSYLGPWFLGVDKLKMNKISYIRVFKYFFLMMVVLKTNTYTHINT